MPETGIDAYERFARTGVCWCGNFIGAHANSVDQLKTKPFMCSLTTMEVELSFRRGSTATA